VTENTTCKCLATPIYSLLCMKLLSWGQPPKVTFQAEIWRRLPSSWYLQHHSLALDCLVQAQWSQGKNIQVINMPWATRSCIIYKVTKIVGCSTSAEKFHSKQEGQKESLAAMTNLNEPFLCQINCLKLWWKSLLSDIQVWEVRNS